MKRASLAAAAALTILGSSLAFAQTTIIISPEQRTRIKEYIVREHVRPVPFHERLTVGTMLPADVELVPVPDAWGPDLRSYRYFYSGEDVVLVDPSSRRVIDVIE
jgi:hypothetical protein